MTKPFVIGLTGGMGAGKSTVISYMRKNKVHPSEIFDCDEAVHTLYENPIMVAWLTDKFGDMKGNARKTCTALVMSDDTNLDTLQNMFMPLVNLDIQERLTFGMSCRMFIDAPLLFETGMEKICNKVVVVHCPEAVRIERVMKRPGMTVAKCELLLSRQLSDDERLQRADYSINTDCSFSETEKQVELILAQLEEDEDDYANAI